MAGYPIKKLQWIIFFGITQQSNLFYTKYPSDRKSYGSSARETFQQQ